MKFSVESENGAKKTTVIVEGNPLDFLKSWVDKAKKGIDKMVDELTKEDKDIGPKI